MKMNKIREYIKENIVTDRVNAIEWGVLTVVLLLIFLTLFYVDNLGMFLTYFWINEELFTLKSIRFLGNNQLSYGIVQQLFCELWTLPVNIVYRFCKFEIANTATVLWFKSSMVFIFCFCLVELKRISDIIGIGKDKIKWLLLLFSSTILVALPVFHIAQTDALYMYLMLRGLRAILSDDRKSFVVFFMLATSCKLISVFAFIPVLLIYEKRILYIIRDSVLVIIIVPLERIWYKIVDMINGKLFVPVSIKVPVETEINGVSYTTTKTLDELNNGFFSHFYHKMLFFEFPAVRKGYVVSVLVFLFVLLCIWCYLQQGKEDKLLREYVLYASAISMLIFFTFASPSPYWIVIMYPLLFLMYFANDKCLRVNMLLINAYTWMMLMVYVIDQDHVYGGATNLDFLLFSGLRKATHSINDGPTIGNYLCKLKIDGFMNVITAICLASAVAITAINHPRCAVDEKASEEEMNITLHGFAIFQIAALCVWYLLCVWSASSW